MDLLSLPNEMLTNVLKYTKFARLKKLRKMNERIDFLSKRTKHCGKISVKILEVNNYTVWPDITPRSSYRINCFLSEEDALDLNTKQKISWPYTIINLPKILSKITVEEKVVLQIMRRELSRNVVSVLQKYKMAFCQVKSLVIDTYFNVSETTLNLLIYEVFPTIDSISIWTHEADRSPPFVQALVGRKWNSLSLTNTGRWSLNTYLQDAFLNEVVVNCKEVDISAVPNHFTFQAVIQLIKTCLKLDGSKFDRKLKLGAIGKRGVPYQYFDKILASPFFEGAKYTRTIKHSMAEYKILLLDGTPGSYIQLKWLNFLF